MCVCVCVCVCVKKLVDAEASLEASELAAVVKLQCTAAVHRFLRGDGQLNTSAAMQSKARMHRIYGLPGLYTKQLMVLHVPCIRVVCF